ncbi:PAS domain-containing protein [Hymenobacter lutimineralis]|uniref:histidine kinase n=1 Tax=Hymenobacter lutimineralis TaxID=2606448 RepID=A0A5D6V9D9_9BACT|nr:PAS domain-containing protein [Hymenobacter lutimineralis]TYZ11867.1 PAS domain-containing protein [Hymenobacter lutimineralis]
MSDLPDSSPYDNLHAAIEAAGIGTWDFNPLSGSLRWSDRCKELFGLPADALIDYSVFLAGLHPDDRAKTDAVVQQALQPTGTGEYDIEYRTIGLQDGKLRRVRATGQAVFDEARTRAVRFVGTVMDVTQRYQQAQDYQAVIEYIPQMVWLTDPAGYHTFFNQRWTDYTGYTLAQSQGTEMWNNLLHPDDRARAQQVWGRSLQTGEDYEIEYRFKGVDGAYRWFLGLAKPIRDEQGEITRWFGTCTDIHDQKLAEAQLRSSEERYHMASLATNDAIWDWNLQTNSVSWNDAIFRLYGYTRAEVEATSQWWYEHIHPADASRVVDGIHRVIDNGHTMWQDEYRYRRADGSYAYVHDRGYVSHGEDGRPIRMIGAMQDVTEQRQIQRALRERDEEFASLADNMAQLAWMAKPDGYIYWYNQQWYDYTGTTLAEMQGQGWKKVHHPDHLARVAATVDAAWDLGKAWELTFPLRGRNGAYRWFLTRAVPVHNEQGKLVRWLGTNTDVTEQKQLQEQLERAYSDLEAKIVFRTLDLEHQVQELRRRLGE